MARETRNPPKSSSRSSSRSSSQGSSNSSQHTSVFSSNGQKKPGDLRCTYCKGDGVYTKPDWIVKSVKCSRCHGNPGFKEAKPRLAPCRACCPSGDWSRLPNNAGCRNCDGGMVNIRSCNECKGMLTFSRTEKIDRIIQCVCVDAREGDY